jgi:hypothetical protein
MIFAHVMGVPVEESALTLAPAGAAILTGAAVIARSKLAEISGWRRRHGGALRQRRVDGPAAAQLVDHPLAQLEGADPVTRAPRARADV